MFNQIRISNKDVSALSGIDIDYESLENDFYDYSNVVVKKPWGYEYLIYCNDIVAIWILHIQCGAQTSMHCHPNKNTGLIVLNGEIEYINTNLKFQKMVIWITVPRMVEMLLTDKC